MNPVPSMEKIFTEKLTEIVEDNFTKEQFNVSDITAEMGMSRATLHRKVKAITGKTLSQFINAIRLKAAKQLLTDRSGTVSEVACMVGFRSLSYFNKCFRDYYGYPPGKLLNGNNKNAETVDTSRRKNSIYLKIAGMLVLVITLLVVIGNNFIKETSSQSFEKLELPSTNQTALNLYRQGLKLMEVYSGSLKEEHYLEAKMKYEEAIGLDSTFGDAYSHLAGIYLSNIWFSRKANKDLNYADYGRICLDRAEEFGVTDSDFLVRTNSIYYQRKGEYSKALELFEKLWENKEKDFTYYSGRGNHGFHATNYSDGIGYIMKYLELKPDSILPDNDRLYKLTLMFSWAGFQKEAQEFAYRQYELKNNKVKYWNWYPKITFECGNFDEAIKTYETAYAYNNVGITVYNKLLEIYMLTGQHVKALKVLPEYVGYSENKYDTITPNYLLGYYHRVAGENEISEWHFKEEIKRWESFLFQKPNAAGIQTYYTIASCYSMLKDKKGTIESLKKLYQKNTIPYIVVIQLQSSPMFDDFRDDRDFINIKNKIEKKYFDERSKIEKVLAHNPLTYSFIQEGTIVSTPL